MPQSQFLKVALEAAQKAEEVILRYYSDSINPELKADGTPVTIADTTAEKVIIETIQRRFPDHGFLGEESGTVHSQSGYQWIIDPIDGTKNYIRNIPLFATQIALMKNDELILGISNSPVLKEVLYAERGEGAFLNDQQIHVSSVSEISEAMVCHGGLRWFSEKGILSNLCDLIDHSYRSRGFGDFYMYHLLASGRADIVIESDIKIWDIAALTVILEEAGGRATDLQGKRVGKDTVSMVATNNVLHDSVFKYFS
ncbi:inositol-phosphate phosphatase [Candidatus Poribacteria bacterium]|nr:inositol-phosphate phosphatase [Candidatus Poribacteria bacterium]